VAKVEIKKRVCGREVTFDVFDSTANFTSSRWKRVVAVFVNGQDWQFRDWKNGTQKRELFARVRAYYLYFEGTKIPPSIETWNVLRLAIPRHKRHQDVNVLANLWNDLEQFLKREKFKGCDF